MRICLLLFIIVLRGFTGHSQSTFGELTADEKAFFEYKKDSTASAIYLYEYGNNYFEVRGNYVWLITEYHAKIKVLKRDGFDQANIKIPTYKGENRSEKVLRIKAVTHNGSAKHVLRDANIFTTDLSDKWQETRFTFSDVKVGSVLEYQYEIQSPFHFNLSGWEFQKDIPKLYTEYNAEIPGNWVYNRVLLGEIPLVVNEATLKPSCFSIPGMAKTADCEVLHYVMKNVPAFKASEAFMLSGENYRSRLKFELSEYYSFKGYNEKYTKSWNDVDKEFRKDQDIGRQLKKNGFFEKRVPEELLSSGEPLERAKNIYAFVKEHFAWNQKNGLWNDNRVKEAFEERRGNASEINISLINLLKTAGIKTDMMLLATRDQGLPTKTHPVMSDFNYVVARTEIADEVYLLDATDKLMPFGMLPFKCLNYYGRVMDFKEASYWHTIEPEKRNVETIRVKMQLNPTENHAQGSMLWISMGYNFLDRKHAAKNLSNDEILETIEEGFGEDFSITDYKENEESIDEKRIIERLDFEIANIVQEGTIYLDPFLIKFIDENPFKSKERYYPIDFGYTRSNTYSLELAIPEGYQVTSLPSKKVLALPGNAGILRFECKKTQNNTINVLFDFKLKSSHFKSEAYQLIKEFFQYAVQAQTKSYIVLKKT